MPRSFDNWRFGLRFLSKEWNTWYILNLELQLLSFGVLF